LEIWLSLELFANLVSEVGVSEVLPPVLGENIFLFGCHLGVLGNNIFCHGACRNPDLALVVSEVFLFLALTLEVEVEPHQELSGEYQ
jgi:hypothetical protein